MRKKMGASILSILVLSSIGAFFSGNIVNAYSSGNVVKSIEVTPDTIKHGESFSVKVAFGGIGTRVQEGQKEIINFSSN